VVFKLHPCTEETPQRRRSYGSENSYSREYGNWTTPLTVFGFYGERIPECVLVCEFLEGRHGTRCIITKITGYGTSKPGKVFVRSDRPFFGILGISDNPTGVVQYVYRV
jgi:hypothetical protein